MSDRFEAAESAPARMARDRPNWRLVLEYDGTDFAGWQRQAGGARTVQGVLEAALAQLAEGPVAVLGAGRTDAGVHAEGQVANARAAVRLEAAALLRALNAILPADVAVRALSAAPDDYHARGAARAKLYAYRLWTGEVRSPLRERRALWKRPPLALEAMREAAALLVGTHDFASFQAAGGSVRTTERTVRRAEWIGAVGGDLRFEVEGPGFLRHMVRNLVGSLLEVGRGRRSPAWIGELLAVRDRTRAGPTAPARGLTLVSVDDGFPLGIQDLGEASA
jgi:tRNA pseudouridine38-40 synthase